MPVVQSSNPIDRSKWLTMKSINRAVRYKFNVTFLIHMNLQSDPQSTYYRLRFCSWQDGVELDQPLEINQSLEFLDEMGLNGPSSAPAYPAARRNHPRVRGFLCGGDFERRI